MFIGKFIFGNTSRDRNLTASISSLLTSEYSRYRDQAKLVLDQDEIEISMGTKKVRFWIENGNIHYKKVDIFGNALVESEMRAPEETKDKITALLLIFAQSEVRD